MSDLDGLEPSPAVSGQIYPIGGMTRDDIIEAGARAHYEQFWGRGGRNPTVPWSELGQRERDRQSETAARYYDAMEPWITLAATQANDREWCANMDSAGVRPDGQEFTAAVLAAIRADERAKVAEEIAAAAEARIEEQYAGPECCCREGIEDAIRIAREAGKR